MSSKLFDPEADIVTLRSAINEVIDITGSIFYPAETAVKKFSNIASSSTDPNLGGYWQSMFDSAYNSSLSTAIFDVTYGHSTASIYSSSVTDSSSHTQKVKIYRQFAGLLLGDKDAHFTVNSANCTEALFLSIKRDIFKDEIKKGSVNLVLNGEYWNQYTASDVGAATSFKQSVGGDYAPLYSGSTEVGQVWYNAGIIIVNPDDAWGAIPLWSGSKTLVNLQDSGSINNIVDGFRKKTERVVFHNQVNICSTSYYIRANNSEFNYSSNATFIDDEKRIRVTSGSNAQLTRTYITTIGLYDANDNLLAVAKLNKPVVKSPENEAVFRVRLDF